MRKLLTFALGACMTAGLLYAQKSDNSVQKFKNAFQSTAFQLSGFGQVQYNANQYANRTPLSGDQWNSSFDVVRAFITAAGKLGTENQFGYSIMFDFGPTSRVLDLYGEWTPLKEINLRYGQYKVPFTIENPMSMSKIETINNTRSLSAMTGSGGDVNQWTGLNATTGTGVKGLSNTGRDVGFEAYGNAIHGTGFSYLEYSVGLFNGNGITNAAKDNNNHKDIVGTVYIYPIKGLKFGGSIYSGKYSPWMPAAINNSYVTGLNEDRWTVGGEYSGTVIYARAEYLASNDGGWKRAGYYGSVVWKCVPDKWEIVGKYEFYNQNTQIDKKGISDLTLGVNFYLAKLTRLQLNYIYTDNQALGKNNALAAQMQVFF